jgi:amino acid transporter
LVFRFTNPLHAKFTADVGGFPTMASLVLPMTSGGVSHTLAAVLFQGAIAILVLVGFESCTALGAEAQDPKTSVPKGVILALVVQGLMAYMFEYFCANMAICDKLTNGTGKAMVTGMAAAGASSAPIGDIMRMVGDSLFHGMGFALDVIMGITVVLACIGTTLACLNTGVRVSYAMAKDKEMPEILGLMHGKFGSPIAGVWILTGLSTLIGFIGVYNIVGLTGISIASNLGTFILYGLICVWTIVAFANRPDRNILLHVLVPLLGLILNVTMVATIFYLNIASGGASRTEGFIAMYFAGGWAIISIIYVVITGAKSGRKLVSAGA